MDDALTAFRGLGGRDAPEGIEEESELWTEVIRELWGLIMDFGETAGETGGGGLRG